jgi:hypothetical protein
MKFLLHDGPLLEMTGCERDGSAMFGSSYYAIFLLRSLHSLEYRAHGVALTLGDALLLADGFVARPFRIPSFRRVFR